MATGTYKPSEIEPKRIKEWEDKGVYKTSDSPKDKQYVLGMFPYPSGDGLHTGHGRIFTAVDVVARYLRMKGKDVLMPVGWDAFGLPAENAAIKAKTNPMSLVPKNEANFKRQMQMLGLSFDWEKAFSTTDPDYYRWTQWIFLKLYSVKNNKGERLVYRKEVPINWCPKCLTGLANEEVEADGTHERCGTVVTQRMLPQWVMRITDYSDRLLDGLIGLDWPKGILEMQKNWIGRREGTRVKWRIDNGELTIKEVETFTTRLDTIYGVTFVAVSPELAKKLDINTTSKAVNPINGEEVPVLVADYVLDEVGTGAVMGVPFYDERDKEFAEKMGLPMGSGKLVDLEETLKELEDKKEARKEVIYHLRDWIFSRQRYWGEPIPLIYCKKCGDENGVVTVPEEELPLKLPELDSYEPTDDGRSPLSRVDEFVKTTCPRCGGEATRETDTMPNWAGSCWYFLRFTQKLEETKTQNLKWESMDEEWKKDLLPEIEKWMPVDWYLGGAEHAVLHLLYARFWVKVLFDLGYLPFDEPFKRLRSVGMVLASDGKKMSKSLGNVINPDDVVEKFGADAVRIYEMFMGPWDQVNAWEERSLIGCRRFLDRVWNLVVNSSTITPPIEYDLPPLKLRGGRGSYDPSLRRELDKLIEKVGSDIEEFKFNTAIAAMMKFTNNWKDSKIGLSNQDIRRFLLILAPFAPFMAEELYQLSQQGVGVSAESANQQFSIHKDKWPSFAKASEGQASDEEVSIVVQVNGKVRGVVKAKGDLEKAVLNDEKIKKWVEGKKYKTIVVKGKLINFVLK